MYATTGGGGATALDHGRNLLPTYPLGYVGNDADHAGGPHPATGTPATNRIRNEEKMSASERRDAAATLDPTTLHEMITSGRAPRLLDVRTPAEFETAHIPGAYNVPLDLLREHREELRTHLDENVVLICRSGARATQAEQALAGVGLPNLKVLGGGMLAWRAAGAPVNQGRPRWDLERQVRLVAGSIVLLGILASTVIPGAKWIAAFIGAGLTVAALTNTCAMGMLLSRLPYNRGASCDLDSVVGQLRAAPVPAARS